eukprot:SAG11_NODE_9179_length_935_cov_0.861244_3_plen_34_part_01
MHSGDADDSSVVAGGSSEPDEEHERSPAEDGPKK